MTIFSRTLSRLGSIDPKAGNVALAAVVLCSAVIVHGVLVVMPSDSNATLAGAGNDIVVRLAEHSQPTMLEPFGSEIIRGNEHHDGYFSLINQTGAPPQSPANTDSINSSTTPQQTTPPASPPKRSTTGRTAIADGASTDKTSVDAGKPAISALAAAGVGEPLSVTISALSDEDADGIPDLVSAPPAISATAR
jgi:hypothetical protein